jgi:renalase
MTNTSAETIVIGAGLAGLTAALGLSRAGRSVMVLDKGRGVGGRLATRRIGDATLDHGAQFFTVRGDAFREVITAAQSDGVVDIWCHGFDGDDGYPRFYCPAGMTALAKWMADKIRDTGGTITTDERASAIEPTDTGWRVSLEAGTSIAASNLIATPPVPQTLELLRAGEVVLDASVTNALEAIAYKPTLALLITLDGPSAVLPPGGIQNTEDDLFTFIADNYHKGVSATSALTFHVNGSVSTDHWDDNPAILIAKLLAEAAPWIGDAPIVDVELKKWKYAGPYTPHPERCVVARTEPGHLVLAGDAFGGPKVEGAFNSGQAAAAAIGS